MVHALLIKILNVLAYVFLLSANVYSGLESDDSGSPYHNSHVTYISPAPFVFGVWGLIHLLLGGFVIYQFWDSANEVVTEVVHWHFICIALLNTLWLTLWENNYLILAVIVVLFISGQISFVYYHLQRPNFVAQNWADKLFIHAPFSLYHAWIAVILTLSIFAAVTPEKTDEPPILLVKIVVVIALFILKSLSVAYIEGGNSDIAGSIVIAWTLIGIFVEQQDPIIHWTSLVLAILSIFHIVKGIFVLFNRARSGEYQPLNP
ncbi:7336_t:CDS:2 [Dentiscutata heterogama]|uniref:7336_t:CDS:1 n=1 Tax=Dentiscutata heterogama TaxID=1316150 RepID=A0ACA9KYM1_9GLOM|nr:7336_t:CDS:2 [Dentiscutata heterogama]